MIRIGALNDDHSSSRDCNADHPKEPSQEVQEENALKLYNEALLELRNGNFEKAEESYKNLLASNLLSKVIPEERRREKKPDDIHAIYGKPSWILKYSCLKNLAVISVKKDELDAALDYYSQALDIEASDVSMWHQMGVIALKLGYMNIACEAFLEGLQCSPRNWLCLDKVVICFFCKGDYILCLQFIAKAFSMDADYTRGQVLRDYMVNEQPSLTQDIKVYAPTSELYFGRRNGEKDQVREKLLEEALRVRSRYFEKCRENSKPKEPIRVDLPKVMEKSSWVCLGQSLLAVYHWMTSQDTHISFLSPINLKNGLQEIHVEETKTEETGTILTKEQDKSSPEKSAEEATQQKDEADDSPEKKWKRNRGSALMEELLWGGKRRSARVRTSRKDQEPLEVSEALRRILPRKLLHKTKQLKPESRSIFEDEPRLDENSMDTMDLYRLFERQESAEEQQRKEEMERTDLLHGIDNVAEAEGYFGSQQERADIIHFIEKHDGGVVADMLKSFAITLSKHHGKTWPNLLPSIFLECYQLMRSHHPVSSELCISEEGYRNIMEEADAVLLYGELQMDHMASLPDLEPSKAESLLPFSFMADLMDVSSRPYLFASGEEHFEFMVRLYWLRCHMFLARDCTTSAITALYDIIGCYDFFPQNETTLVTRKNCRSNRIISRAVAEDFLAFQSRKRSLVEVVRLYEDECYQELTDILKETFSSIPVTGNDVRGRENELVDRQTQLSMLVNGLHHLDQYKECVFWLETCCYEVMQRESVPAALRDYKAESWCVVLDRFLLAMEDCMALGNVSIMDALPAARVPRFTQTLCHALCKQMEEAEKPPCPARPWIMLNRILVEVEATPLVLGPADVEEEDDDENDIPPSILLLFTAHDYLGRREWCSHNDNVLLFLIMDQVIPRVRKEEWSSFRQTIQQHLEQVVYCLYAHPNKKTKGRYITDHNVTPIPLKWNRAMQLFQLFRPDETPAFDSLRVNLISSDTEVLFRRIAALIPDENDPVQNSEKMRDFIVGNRDDVCEADVKLPEHVRDLFYILGDYYIKTHEQAKAVNYLLIDLCANPDRVDSWASMALSRAAILEQKLNSCDPVKDEELLLDSLCVLRCYEHCLQLEKKQSALWIEYGTFVYTIHSFCSQRMKLQSDSLSLEQFQELETTKNNMLDTAKQAFLNANLIWYELQEENERQDERWLHHYMLGKICEKNGDLGYFEQYGKAAELLYENEAQYPSKVGYTTPQTLAVEALEVYYRIHVCVIKSLELNEGTPLELKTRLLFSKYLDICSQSAFVKQVSKTDLTKIKAKEAESLVEEERQKDIIKNVLDGILEKIENGLSVGEPRGSCIDSGVKEENDTNQETEKEKTDEKKMESEKEDDPECDTKCDTSAIQGQSEGEVRAGCDKMETSAEPEVEAAADLLSLAAAAADKFEAEFNMKPEALLRPRVVSEPPHIPHIPQDQLPPAPPARYLTPAYDEDNYYITLDDIKNMTQTTTATTTKRKRRTSAESVSSSSSDSGDIKYDDSSSSSSSSSSDSETSSSSSSTSDSPDMTLAAQAEQQGAVSSADTEQDNSEAALLKRSLVAMETCALRFPQHYKSVYRLAHFFFRSKEHRDIQKCRDLLLGQYQTPQGTISGLFADRKNTNFFNGIWRIPAGDVDRPGSFAAHMSRSVLLLVEVLRDLKDYKMLLELSLQLRKVPEPDKKYLREDERNQLAGQALNLTIQTLKKNMKEATVMTLPLVLDAYRCYQKVQRHSPTKEAVFGDILLEAFKRLGKGDKCTLEQATRFCHSELLSSHKANKISNMNVTTAAPVATPKPKAKKQEKEKKKRGPKPQNPKTQKPEQKKRTVEKTKIEKAADTAKPVIARTSSSSSIELMKGAVQAGKKQTPSQHQHLVKSMLQQMSVDYNQHYMMMASQFGQFTQGSQAAQTVYPGTDYAEFYKQYANLYSSTLISNYLAQPSPAVKKPRTKVTKPRPVSIPAPQHKDTSSKPKLESKPETKSKPEPKPEAKLKIELKLDAKPKAKLEIKPKTFNIDDILAKPSKISKPQSPNVAAPSQITSSTENKIKNALVDPNEGQTEAINLSPDRKTVKKRVMTDASQPDTSKKICKSREEVEVVTIDD